MSITKQFKLEIDVWCTDERHFDDLIKELEYANCYENARYGGYGFEVKISDKTKKKLRKSLELPKEVDCDCE